MCQAREHTGLTDPRGLHLTVEKVSTPIVAHDTEGKVYTVRYEAVNAMLLNEFLKEHRRVQELEKQIEALTATVQKVSYQLELNKPCPANDS